LAVVTAGVVLPAAALVVRFANRAQLAMLSFLAVTLLGLLAGLHLTDYRSLIAGQGPLLQGRYLLPLVALFGITVAFGIHHLPRRVQAAGCGVVIAGLLVLQVLSLSTVMQAYYT
jgi:hypothetical protein